MLAINDNKENMTDCFDKTELIAVLTAVISASLNTSTYNLNIKSYKRISNCSPVWNSISRIENTQNKL